MNTPNGVVLLTVDGQPSAHERAVHQILGEKLATMLGCAFLGPYDPRRHTLGGYYFLPDETLVGNQDELGIQGPQDLFGGVVPYPFVCTKAISHPLIENPRHIPEGWSAQMAEQAGHSILKGYTVFDLEDARPAGERLLRDGAVRLKPVRGKAGRGQEVVHCAAELGAALDHQDAQEVRTWGLVLEEDLRRPDTYSVGQIRVGRHTLSYYGTQHLTHDNHDHKVYGGSSLTLVRGDYTELMALDMPRNARLAVQQARIYELAAFDAHPGLFASRRNYDVARGLDANGQPRSGVLEQSWRVGGASAAELFALEAFIADPGLQRLDAATHERYGEVPAPPGAICLYRGEEPELGLLSKYVTLGAP
ncbi:MAG: DUF3182 family protein [Pseudomonas sp.]|uniref:DUF3182 family protein n=1 Tax=Pseudomonas sp. TaxID=306 RepID=UPI003D1520B0